MNHASLLALTAVLSFGTGHAATTVIHAGHLIAEPGKPETLKQSIVIEGDKIVAVQDGFVPGDTVINLEDSWVMPGLIDMHVHVTGVLDLTRPPASQLAEAYHGQACAARAQHAAGSQDAADERVHHRAQSRRPLRNRLRPS